MSIEEIFRMIASKNKPEPTPPPTWIVVGLGNPGEKYKNTRHNVGFRVMDALASKYNYRINRLAHKALTEKVALPLPNGEKAGVLLMMPQTYMNASGEAVGEAARYYKIEADHVLVVYDDVSIPEGHIRIRAKGSAGGHNGIKSLIQHLGTEVFPRIRVGVGSPEHPEHEMIDWVLGAPLGDKAKDLAAGEARAVDAIAAVIAQGATRAGSTFNGPPKSGKDEK